MALERMDAFFDARVEGYEEHMMTGIEGADAFYAETARHLPLAPGFRLLDLGCGTGLELDEVFSRVPDARVTGVDLSAGMLAKLREKHGDKALTLLQGSYFDLDYGCGQFEAAVSVESLHHFRREIKQGLYDKIFRCLTPGGVYVETDYSAPDQEYEDFYFAERDRLLKEQGEAGGFFHYDTPQTVKNRQEMLRAAGFARVECVWQRENTTILVAKKD